MSQPSLPDFDVYEELEVSRNASIETIEAAYRSLAKRTHPDHAGDDPAQLARIKRLNVAHDWLTDPALRGLYDATRPTAAGAAPEGHAPVPASQTSSAPPRRPVTSQPARPGRSASDRPGDTPAERFGPNFRQVESLIAEAGAAGDPGAKPIARAAAITRGPTYRVALDHLYAIVRDARPEAAKAAREAAVAAAHGSHGFDSGRRADLVAFHAGLAAEALSVIDLLPPEDLLPLLGPWHILVGPSRPRTSARSPRPHGRR